MVSGLSSALPLPVVREQNFEARNRIGCHVNEVERFGPYEVIEEAGEGAFGVVHRGRPPDSHGTVLITTGPPLGQEFRQAFLEAASLASHLQHPNVTRILDFGIEEETPYLVQEVLRGESLAEGLRREQAFSLGSRLEILTQVASGLQFAHDNGVVHGLVGPSSVQILPDGRVKIGDFGLASWILAGKGSTRVCAAPEELRGEAPDPRSDVFCFGATAYELFSGNRPFEGETAESLRRAILEEEPVPLRQSCSACPAALEEILNRCLAKDPDQRPQGFGEVITALDAVQVAPSSSPARPTPMPRAPSEAVAEALTRGRQEAEQEKADRPSAAFPESSASSAPWIALVILLLLLIAAAWWLW